MSSVIPTIEDVGLGGWEGFMEKVSVKTGSQRRKLKGKKIQWNLLMQGDMQMYTEMCRDGVSPWVSFQYQIITHTVKSICWS